MAERRTLCSHSYNIINQIKRKFSAEVKTRITLNFFRPGKPTDNPFIESFNGSFKDECLSTNWFLSLQEAEGKIESYIREYNEFRPHRSLQVETPQEAENEYILETKKADFSNNAWS